MPRDTFSMPYGARDFREASSLALASGQLTFVEIMADSGHYGVDIAKLRSQCFVADDGQFIDED